MKIQIQHDNRAAENKQLFRLLKVEAAVTLKKVELSSKFYVSQQQWATYNIQKNNFQEQVGVNKTSKEDTT